MQALVTAVDPASWVAPMRQLAKLMTEVHRGAKEQAAFDIQLRTISTNLGKKDVKSFEELRARLLEDGIFVRLSLQGNGEYHPDLAKIEPVKLTNKQIEDSVGELCKLAKLELPVSPEIYLVTNVLLRAPYSVLPVGAGNTAIEVEPSLRVYSMLNQEQINKEKLEWPSPERREHVMANELTHLAIRKTFPNVHREFNSEVISSELPFPVRLIQIEESFSDLGSMMKGEPIGIVISRAATAGREDDYGLSALLINQTYQNFFATKIKELSAKPKLTPEEAKMLAVVQGAVAGIERMKERKLSAEVSTQQLSIFLMQESRKNVLLDKEMRNAVVLTFQRYLLPLREAFVVAEKSASKR